MEKGAKEPKALPGALLVVYKQRVAEEQWTFFEDGSLWHLRFDRGRVLEEELAPPSAERLKGARRLASLLRVLKKDPKSRRQREDPGESEPLRYRFLLGEAAPVLSFERPERGVPREVQKRIAALLAPKAPGRVPPKIPAKGPAKNKGGLLKLPGWIARAKPYALAMGLDEKERKDVRAFLKKHKLPFTKAEKGSYGDGRALRHPWFFWPSRKPAKAGEWTVEFEGRFFLARVWRNPKRAR
ncbi:MAG TPA: hypothetical protein ENK02_09265 [Planctomycetes bacterium]|nr:hypothetical protein [Planctomycetota bacterium]